MRKIFLFACLWTALALHLGFYLSTAKVLNEETLQGDGPLLHPA